MKREIEFRGKTAKGEWVYGSFINSVVKGSPFGYIAGNNVVEPIQVMRKTVGQYVGIKDKNGKKVYEGDIVKVRITQTEDKQTYGDCKYKIGAIVYNEDFALFTCKNNFMNFINWAFNDYEVIGSIFDKESEK